VIYLRQRIDAAQRALRGAVWSGCFQQQLDRGGCRPKSRRDSELRSTTYHRRETGFGGCWRGGDLAVSKEKSMVERAGRKRRTAISVLRVFLGLVFVTIGVAKLSGTLNTVETFEDFGWGQWFRYATGVIDLVGALLVFVPRWTFTERCC
jgi:DoxX-like family